MAALKQLRERAKALEIPARSIRGADSDELRSMIENAEGGNKPRRAVKKSSVKKAAAKKRSGGNSASRKSAPAKSTSGRKAKRQTSRKASKATKSTSTNGYVPKGGRNVLDGVDYSVTDGWNPREDSAPDRIVRLLRKFRGNREKVYDALLPDIGDFVKSKKSNGQAWEKGDGPGSRKAMLRYRIARTAWQFALQTGQHDVAGNRVKYGTGGTGQGVFKPAKRKILGPPKRKAARKSSTTTRGRKKAAQSRAGRKATTARKNTRRRTTRRKRS